MDDLFKQPLDVFIDLTAGELCPLPERFTVRARRVTCVTHPNHLATLAPMVASLGWTLLDPESAVAACTDAMSRAAADRALFLLLSGPVLASDEALSAMRHCLDLDPMFGCAAARIRCERGCCFRRPSQNGLAAGYWIPRRALAEVPEMEVGLELFDASLLLRPEIVAEFGPLDGQFSSLPGAVLNYLGRARRGGYRTVLANRAVMAIRGVPCNAGQPDFLAVPPSDQALLRRLAPELSRGGQEFRASSSERFEQLNAHIDQAARGTRRRSVLLDIRNVTAVHNGTSQAALGCANALHRLSPPWDVTVLAHPSAIPFHDLRKLWRGWELTMTVPRSPFAAALRLSQPWHIQEMIDLHNTALFNLYFMLDTISWDTVYPSPRHLDGTWSFLADHADGFLFNSAFTENRFLARFRRASEVRRTVCHHPFDPAEYRDVPPADAVISEDILVVGNNLDHKDAVRTIELLSAAFPFRPLVSLGPKLTGGPYLRVYESGSVSDHEVNRLYAEARFIIFPSFYEGFGFPVVTALAHGKTILARKSDLLDEIAARCSTGRLIAFKRRDDLVDIVGRLLHDEVVQEEPLGTVVSDVTRRWSDVAGDIVRFVDDVSGQPDHSRWVKRAHAINQLLAFSN
ncbi:MAG: glycosyltransferase [Vicinamibacterales bacterium]|nr:glycosyltransferase [Vicinamibacterales bacterium]